LPGNLARLADDVCDPGWPLPKNGSTDAAQGLWDKMFFSHQSFAALRLRVNPLSRSDRPPDPERLPGSRARLADGGSGPGWPLPRNGSIDAARGFWRKMSFSHRNFAASRLRVNP